MVSSDCEAGTFLVRAQNRDGPYKCQELIVHCNQFFFLIVERLGPVGNRAATSMFLFLRKYTPFLFVTNIGIDCSPPFCSR